MNSFDIGITNEVLLVKGQNPADAVDSHCGHSSRIVDLNTGDIVRDKHFAPFPVDRQTVRQQPQLFLKRPGTAVSFLKRKRVPVAMEWTSAGVPEFGKILRRVAEDDTALKNSIDCRDYERIIAIIRLYPEKEDVAIN